MLKKIAIITLISLLISGSCHGQGNDKSSTLKAGDALQHLIPLTALGTTIFYEEGPDGTIQLLKSYIAAVLVTEGLKQIIEKERPNGTCCDSFPSKHATKAFAGAGFIHKRYGWKYAIPAYVGAGYVAYSWVDGDVHYWEDVVVGAAVGIVSSFYFTKPYKGITITPVAGSGYIGVNLSSTW
jgi:membrane-associated phospholipid phosphatase